MNDFVIAAVGTAPYNEKQALSSACSEHDCRDEYDCPICLEFCAQPVVTPCKHFFCFPCQKEVVKKGMACPLCRTHFGKKFVLQIDQDFQKIIRRHKREAFEERKNELKKAGLWVCGSGRKRSLRLLYGNTHEMVQDPKASYSNPLLDNKHQWVMSVTCNNEDVEENNVYIKSVTYHLHPTFRQNVVKVDRAPFLLSRMGWVHFEVDIEVEFQAWTKLPVMKLSHMLNFKGRGNFQSVTVKIK